ncbi:MAG TPA: hypothetical protein VHD36_12540 [Pirellulales bacterium]|nr:hypothetical protein [Pirellulales bacterium]
MTDSSWPYRRLLLAVLATVFVAAGATSASAQFFFPRRAIYPYGFNAWGGYGWGNPYYGYGYGRRSYSGRGFGMAGTPLSSAEFGAAQMMRASGYRNLENSQALRNDLQARSTDINNRATWTGDYYQMRQAHRASDARSDRLSAADVTKLAHDAAPHELDATQADPKTGKIRWPVILQDVRYIEGREEVENLYRTRVSGNQSDAESYLAYNKSCEALLQTLKANIADYAPNDYQQARHFVENLRATGRPGAN